VLNLLYTFARVPQLLPGYLQGDFQLINHLSFRLEYMVLFLAWSPIRNSSAGSKLELEATDHSFFSLNPGQFACSQSCVTRAVCAGHRFAGRRSRRTGQKMLAICNQLGQWTTHIAMFEDYVTVCIDSCLLVYKEQPVLAAPNTFQPTPSRAAQTFRVQ